MAVRGNDTNHQSAITRNHAAAGHDRKIDHLPGLRCSGPRRPGAAKGRPAPNTLRISPATAQWPRLVGWTKLGVNSYFGSTARPSLIRGCRRISVDHTEAIGGCKPILGREELHQQGIQADLQILRGVLADCRGLRGWAISRSGSSGPPGLVKVLKSYFDEILVVDFVAKD